MRAHPLDDALLLALLRRRRSDRARFELVGDRAEAALSRRALRERVVRQLVSLPSRPRAEAQVAACRALVAVCRFEALQQEWVAEQGVPPLVALLESEVREVQVAACLAAEAVGSHPEGQEAS